MLLLNFKDFQKESKINKYINYVDMENIHEIYTNKTVAANFWIKILEIISEQYIGQKQKKVARYHINFKPCKKHATYAFLKKVVAYTTIHINRDIKDCFFSIYPMLEFVEQVSNSTNQILQIKSNKDISYHISKSILNAPTPFNDNRFRLIPMHSRGIDGLCSSEWLTQEKGVLFQNSKTNKIERSVNCYKEIFLDTKLAVLFLFKDLPSITLSFYFDNNKNIYIQQIQSQKKDRGHYKIKNNWRNGVVKYFQSIFKDYKIHLISGKSVNDILVKQYEKSGNTISNNLLDNIRKIYDNMCYSKNIVSFNNFNYNTLK